MEQHQFIGTPNQSIIAIALRLYNEIITQSCDKYEHHHPLPSDRRKFLARLISIRDDRKIAFPNLKFCDPYWEIILNAAIDFESGKETSIKAACLSSGVSATTTLRCLGELESIGVLQRWADPSDRRRYFIRLTDQSKHSFDAWLGNSLRKVSQIEASEMGLDCMDIGSSSYDF